MCNTSPDSKHFFFFFGGGGGGGIGLFSVHVAMKPDMDMAHWVVFVMDIVWKPFQRTYQNTYTALKKVAEFRSTLVNLHTLCKSNHKPWKVWHVFIP